MPKAFPSFHSVAVAADVVLVAATETVIATLPNVSVDDVNEVVSLHGWCVVTTAAGATTHTLRFRRAALAGTLVGEANAVTTVAANNVQLDKLTDDTPGDVASQAYVLTIVSAVGASTVLEVGVQAVVHTP